MSHRRWLSSKSFHTDGAAKLQARLQGWVCVRSPSASACRIAAATVPRRAVGIENACVLFLTGLLRFTGKERHLVLDRFTHREPMALLSRRCGTTPICSLGDILHHTVLNPLLFVYRCNWCNGQYKVAVSSLEPAMLHATGSASSSDSTEEVAYRRSGVVHACGNWTL